jgi:hypothetical protein
MWESVLGWWLAFTQSGLTPARTDTLSWRTVSIRDSGFSFFFFAPFAVEWFLAFALLRALGVLCGK